MKYDHAKPLIEKLMHIAVLYHASSGMLRTKIFDALKEFILDMDDGCFERGCPAIDYFSSHTTITQDKSNTKVGTNSGVLHTKGEEPWVKTYAGGKPNYTTPEEREWVGLDHEMMRNTTLEFNRGALWAERYLKEKNHEPSHD